MGLSSPTDYLRGPSFLSAQAPPDARLNVWPTLKLGEREVAQALLEYTPLRLGLPIVADKGFVGIEFEDFVRELGAGRGAKVCAPAGLAPLLGLAFLAARWDGALEA